MILVIQMDVSPKKKKIWRLRVRLLTGVKKKIRLKALWNKHSSSLTISSKGNEGVFGNSFTTAAKLYCTMKQGILIEYILPHASVSD